MKNKILKDKMTVEIMHTCFFFKTRFRKKITLGGARED